MRDFFSEHFHDAIAGAVTIILTIGVLALYALKDGVPGPISSGWQIALGYTFGVGATKIMNRVKAPVRKRPAA